MLEEHCGNIPATEHDIQIILTFLGSHNALLEKYSSDRSRCLIGSPYYSKMGIIRESSKLYGGRYTIRLMVASLITDFLSITLTFLFLFNNRILNPTLVLNIGTIFEEESDFFIKIFESFNLFFLLAITFILGIDMAATTIRCLTYPK